MAECGDVDIGLDECVESVHPEVGGEGGVGLLAPEVDVEMGDGDHRGSTMSNGEGWIIMAAAASEKAPAFMRSTLPP